MDYYVADVLAGGKFQMVSDSDKLNLAEQRPHGWRRGVVVSGVRQ